MLRYIALFFILNFIYLNLLFFVVGLYDLKGYWIIFASILIIYTTPFIGRKILHDQSKTKIFYISYIALILVILPTWSGFIYQINYPYFMFEGLLGEDDAILLSYALPPLLIGVIVAIMSFRFFIIDL